MPKKRTRINPLKNKQQSSGDIKRQRAWIKFFIFLIIVAAAIPFAFSLGGEFVLDDSTLILANKSAHSLSSISSTFTHCFGTNSPYYRPLVSISFIVNYAMFGQNPIGYKVVNLLLHVLCSLLVFFFARRIICGNAAPLLAALIFAVHPAHTESISWISGRTDLMATAFALASIIAFCKYYELEKRSLYIISLVLFIGALFSKESVIILPLLLLILAGVREPRPGIKKAIIEIIPFVIIAAIFFFVRLHVLGQLFNGIAPIPSDKRLLAAPAAILWYLRILLLPLRAALFHDIYKPILWNTGIIISAWAAVIGIFISAVVIYKKHTTASLSILWILITLIPVANIVPLPWPVLNERFLYLPSVGYSLLFGLAGAWLISQLPKMLPRARQVSVAIVISIFLAYCAVQSYIGAPLWSSNLEIADQMADSSRLQLAWLHCLAAKTYSDVGDNSRAISEYQKVLKASPKDTKALNELILLHAGIGDFQSVAREARILAGLTPKDPTVYNSLGAALLQMGDPGGAVIAFDRASRLAPKQATTRFNLAVALFKTGNYERSIEQYKIGLELNPNDESAKRELEMVLREAGKVD